MQPAPPSRRLIASLAGFKLVLHLALSNRYGFFRDELYFLDCGRHLDWGYVDHAPLIGLIARLALLLGGSLPVLRIFPALAGAGLVALTMLLAARMGGGRYAQAIAGLAALFAPIYLAQDSILSMNAFEPLFWMGGVLLLLAILQGGDRPLWLAVGALLGLGLMNKHSTAFFGAALAGGLLVTTDGRRELATRWPWFGVGVAFLVFAPNLLWQWTHGFPTLEDLRSVAASGKNVVLDPPAFFEQQVLLLHPVFFPFWAGGLVWLFARGRVLAWTWTFFALGMFAIHAKNYYLAPIYPMLFAAGAVGLEENLARAWGRAAILTMIVVAGAMLAPLALPLLSPEGYLAYGSRLGIEPPKTEVKHESALPQIWADQFGWSELVAEVAKVHATLPPGTAIYANNYGEAGAINHFGPAYDLPKAICAHQTHFFWGPPMVEPEVVIVLQADREDLEENCQSVEIAAEHHHAWGMAEENGPIWVCRGLKRPLRELWPSLKHWN